jgi:hypothetical protein
MPVLTTPAPITILPTMMIEATKHPVHLIA